MDPQLMAVFQSLLLAVVAAVAALLTYAVKKFIVIGQLYLEQKMGQATFTFVKDYVGTTVKFLEQQPIFKEWSGPEKKEKAMTDVVGWCQTKGIPVDHDLIEKLIEAAVLNMNVVV